MSPSRCVGADVQGQLGLFQEPGCGSESSLQSEGQALLGLQTARGVRRWPKQSHLRHCGFLCGSRCYCFECVDTLVGPGASGKVQAVSNWLCFLCLPSPRNGLLQRRRKWRERLKAFYDQDPVRSRSPDRTDWCRGPQLCWLPLATSCRMPTCSATRRHERRLSKCAFSLTAGSARDGLLSNYVSRRWGLCGAWESGVCSGQERGKMPGQPARPGPGARI